MENDLTYSEAMAKVEKILGELNQENFDIDSLAERVKTATELLALCKKKLQKTEQDVEQIINPSL